MPLSLSLSVSSLSLVSPVIRLSQNFGPRRWLNIVPQLTLGLGKSFFGSTLNDCTLAPEPL
jgi:hypothetical protein